MEVDKGILFFSSEQQLSLSGLQLSVVLVWTTSSPWVFDYFHSLFQFPLPPSLLSSFGSCFYWLGLSWFLLQLMVTDEIGLRAPEPIN